MATTEQQKGFTKATAEVLTFWADWTDTLTDESDTISSSAWAVSSGGVAIDSDANTPLIASAVVSGGTDGGTAVIVNTITTANLGHTRQRTMEILIKER